MSNTLLNSMVRGFGSTIGRKAANSVMSTKRTTSSISQQTISKKQLELINEYEGHIKNFQEIGDNADLSFESGKITETEHRILKRRVSEGIEKANIEIEKLKSIKTTSSWPVIIGIIIGLWVVVKMFG
jgi:hypothetical protein